MPDLDALTELAEQATLFGYPIVANYVLGNSPLQAFRARAARLITGRESELDRLTVPQKERLMLEQLGPMYVKLGQIVSSQASLLPEEWRVELDKLQSTVPPFSYQEAYTIIEAELGGPPDQLFASFGREPLAAASTAQVHQATLHGSIVNGLLGTSIGLLLIISTWPPTERAGRASPYDEGGGRGFHLSRPLRHSQAWATPASRRRCCARPLCGTGRRSRSRPGRW